MQLHLKYFYVSKLALLGLFFIIPPGLGQSLSSLPFSNDGALEDTTAYLHDGQTDLGDSTRLLASQALSLNVTDTLSQDSLLQKPAPFKKITLEHDDPRYLLDLMVVKKKPQSKPYIPFIQCIDFSIDYGKLATALFTHFESKYEGGGCILFRKNIQLAVDVGYAELHPQNAFKNATSYTIQGKYGRIGLDYFINYDRANHLFFGLRYGKSTFEDKGVVEIASSVGERFQTSVDRKALTASWFEVIGGSETKLFKKSDLYVGMLLRWRRQHKFENFEPIPVYAIPGYGRTVDKTVPALNLYIKYKLSFLKKEVDLNP